MSDVLNVDQLHVSYGAVVALAGVSINVGHGEAVAIVGPNGSGKTTLLRTISGLVKARSGSVHLDGEPVLSKRSYVVARMGFAHVPEGRGTIGSMSVEENLLAAAARRMSKGEARDKVGEMFDAFPVLQRYRSRGAGLLSGGEQQMLAIARGLMAEPKVLAIDEPSMGLAPIIIGELIDMLHVVVARGVSVLLVEQNAALAGEVASRGYVLVRGKVEAEGDLKDLPDDMLATFLG